MKIVHLIFSFTTGGAETMLVDIVNEQVKHADVSIMIINNMYNQALLAKIDKRVNIFFINRRVGSVNPLPIIKLNILWLKLRADLLHCHSNNIIFYLLPIFRKKTVLTVHDTGLETKYLKFYRKIFAISNIVKHDISRRSNSEAVLVYNGICTEKVEPKYTIASTEILKIVIISRLVHLKKGQHLAIEALHILQKKGIENIHLDIIGEGGSEEFLKRLVVDLKLTNYVTFLGMMDRDYVYTHLKEYDLLIQPSIYEGFGLTVAEAMAAKIPVLVSNVDGPMEIIQQGEFGYYFQTEDAEDLANQLLKIYNHYDTAEMQQIVDKAKIHVEENFNIVRTASTYLEEYSKLINIS